MSLKALHTTGRKKGVDYITESKLILNNKKYELPITLGYTYMGLGGQRVKNWVDIVWDKGSYQLRYYNEKYGLIRKEKINRDLAFFLLKLRLKKDSKLDMGYIPNINFDNLRVDSYVAIQKKR